MASVREWRLPEGVASLPPAAPGAASACQPNVRWPARRYAGRAAAAPGADPGIDMTARLTRLKTRGDFLRVAASRVRAARPGLVLQAAPQPGDPAAALRVGYTASRRVGGAVQRNRAKRRLRAAAVAVLPRCGAAGVDYVLIARDGTAKRPYAELLADLEGALRQVARRRREEG